MEKVPQKRPVEFSGTTLLALASILVLVLVAIMLAYMVWRASSPKPLTEVENEPPASSERVQDAPQAVRGR